MFIASVMSSRHLILWCPLLFLPSIFPSIRDFSNESLVCISWPTYQSFSFSISPSSGNSGLISIKTVRFTLLTVQGTFRSLLQYQFFEGINYLVLCLFSDPAVKTKHDHWEDHRLDSTDLRWQSKVSGFEHCLKFVITFLPRSNSLLISWLQSPCSDFGAQEEKICPYFHLFSFSLHSVMGLDGMILGFCFFFFFNI